MTPSSTVHFSLPTSTQFVRSFPLNSCTHCSPGYGARPFGACGALDVATTTEMQTINKNLDIVRFIDSSTAAFSASSYQLASFLPHVRREGLSGRRGKLRVPDREGWQAGNRCRPAFEFDDH